MGDFFIGRMNGGAASGSWPSAPCRRNPAIKGLNREIIFQAPFRAGSTSGTLSARSLGFARSPGDATLTLVQRAAAFRSGLRLPHSLP
jgi:hypothetical protein